MFTGLIICGVIGVPEAIIIVIAFLVFFGGKKIPELMRGLGQGMKEFKKATQDHDETDEKKLKE
jgi:sec-independent protein translocase protein TatA